MPNKSILLVLLCFAFCFVQKIGHREKKKNSSENPLFAANTEFSSTTGMGGALFTSNTTFSTFFSSSIFELFFFNFIRIVSVFVFRLNFLFLYQFYHVDMILPIKGWLAMRERYLIFLASQDALEVMRVTHSLTESLTKR